MTGNERVAVLPGSYDPITAGHMDLIVRAAALFDRVWVAVSLNGEKGGFFRPEQRLELVELAIAELRLPSVSATLCRGLTAELMREKKASYLVRGVRDCADFDYENDLARIMRRFDSSFETVFLPAHPELSCVSSTYVRELLKYGCPLGDAVPAAVAGRMRELYLAGR